MWSPSKSRWSKAAEKLGPNAALAVEQYIQDVESGKIHTLPMPWNEIGRLTRALISGGITTVCATAGHGKSLFLMQLSHTLHASGIPCEFYMLEHTLVWHANRLYAMLASESRFLDDAWIKANPEDARKIKAPHDETVTNFFYHVKTQPNGQATYRDLLNWLREGADKGVRYFLIDPVTGAKAQGDRWTADEDFLAEARKIIEAANASLMLITHPRKGHGRNTGLDDMANGAAFARFTDCVLWLERPDKPPPVKVLTAQGGNYIVFANRVIKINKASNSIGTGLRIGMKFDNDTLRYKELGIVVRDQDKVRAEGLTPLVTQETPEDIANLFDKPPANQAKTDTRPKPWLQRQPDELIPGEGQ